MRYAFCFQIWFQNRRRKDVIGNSGKPKSCDTSTSSTCSSGSGKESDQQNSPPQNSPISDDNGNNSSDENSSQKEAEQSVVPSLVMKSVIGELIKFTNDPLKGKKKRKKAKSKLQEKSTVKKGLTATLLTGAYDMISPPNQITPTAFFEKIKNGFSHSKNSSAFAVPGDVSKPSQICSVSSTSETGNGNINSSGENAVHISRTLLSDHMASNGRTYPTGAVSFMNNSFSMPAYSTSMPTELPVLTDILSYKSSLDMRAQNDSLKSAPQPQPSSLPSTPLHRSETNKPAQPSHMHPFTPGRSLNGIFPYPFMAEPSMMLSSLRQTDHIFRPAPHYPVSHYSNDPYQPLFITSLSNPYYSPPTAAWNSSHPVPHSTSSYTQL
ncbi:hypothetical protein DPMN_128802 [Dreissena polymorpha]|uniref:Uncharacterized protein n=1 Tax=Dreissena polymorpha TaxID=45954 RepID=A0A9D4H3L7_DREPO|nr:hypothetical protein DPMN_128802 [Dreissena polymorpha]